MWKRASFGKPIPINTYVTVAIMFSFFVHYVIIETSSLREWEFCFVVVHHVHFCGFSFVFNDFG